LRKHFLQRAGQCRLLNLGQLSSLLFMSQSEKNLHQLQVRLEQKMEVSACNSISYDIVVGSLYSMSAILLKEHPCNNPCSIKTLSERVRCLWLPLLFI